MFHCWTNSTPFSWLPISSLFHQDNGAKRLFTFTTLHPVLLQPRAGPLLSSNSKDPTVSFRSLPGKPILPAHSHHIWPSTSTFLHSSSSPTQPPLMHTPPPPSSYLHISSSVFPTDCLILSPPIMLIPPPWLSHCVSTYQHNFRHTSQNQHTLYCNSIV